MFEIGFHSMSCQLMTPESYRMISGHMNLFSADILIYISLFLLFIFLYITHFIHSIIVCVVYNRSFFFQLPKRKCYNNEKINWSVIRINVWFSNDKIATSRSISQHVYIDFCSYFVVVCYDYCTAICVFANYCVIAFVVE